MLKKYILEEWFLFISTIRYCKICKREVIGWITFTSEISVTLLPVKTLRKQGKYVDVAGLELLLNPGNTGL